MRGKSELEERKRRRKLQTVGWEREGKARTET